MRATQLLITRGLPASGKTTFARAWVAQDDEARARVNRDDLRRNLFGIYWPLTYQQEQSVTAVQRAAVRALLEAGTSVIVDDTHLRLAHAREWAKLAGELAAGFDVRDFPTPVDECVRRDAARADAGERAVGEKAIRDLAARYAIGPKFAGFPPVEVPRAGPSGRVYVPYDDLPAAWIVDLDGTLAHMDGRGPFEWSRVGEDSLDVRVDALIRDLRRSWAEILIVSGRDAVCRPETEEWLDLHRVDYETLFMRPEGDRRKDAVVKADIFWNEIAPCWNVLGVLDDRDQVVAMWRSLGLLCLQVAPGAF